MGRMLVSLVLVFAVGVTAGCGASSSKSSPPAAARSSTSPTSPRPNTNATSVPNAAATAAAPPGSATAAAAFAPTAAALCHAVNRELGVTVLDRLTAGKGKRTSTLDAHERAAERALGSLAPPASTGAAWRQLLADRHVLTLNLVTPGHANRSSGTGTQLDTVHKRLKAEATQLGVRDCGLI